MTQAIRRTLTALPASRSPTSTVEAASATAITLTWLVRLRWVFFAAQALTILLARYVLSVDVPIGSLACVVGVSGASNVALRRWTSIVRKPRPSAIGGVFVLDTLILTALLYFSGGPANPFSAFYLVHVTIAAVALGIGWAASIVLLSVASYAALFFVHVNVPAMEHAHHSGSAFSVHLQGMWLALTLAASLIAYFVTRVSAALRAREDELLRVQKIATSREKLASLGTLAAGAAHELGTPLGTIAIASKELERSMRSAPEHALADVQLIRSELERCRDIVRRMSANAGQPVGELPEPTTTTAIAAALADNLSPRSRERVDIEFPEASFEAPIHGLVQVLVNLIQNGLYATPEEQSDPTLAGVSETPSSRRSGTAAVIVTCEVRPDELCFAVQDRGRGISAADLERIGDPFFTTKPPGQGMGLGLFLAQAFAERWHAQLTVESDAGHGTRVTLAMPRSGKSALLRERMRSVAA